MVFIFEDSFLWLLLNEIKNFFNSNNIIYVGHSIEEEISLDFHGIKDSDHLYIILKLNSIQPLIKFFGFVDDALNILIIGGGTIGYYTEFSDATYPGNCTGPL